MVCEASGEGDWPELYVWRGTDKADALSIQVIAFVDAVRDDNGIGVPAGADVKGLAGF